MSERMLEIDRRADGMFVATAGGTDAPVEVSSWPEIRRLRGKTHLVDHWADGTREAFIALHGHPFDDWWASLTPACAQALETDPHGAVSPDHHREVKRTLAHQPRQTGLELEGSLLGAELRAYVAAKRHSSS
jgi:hypothetical protein